ncbi:hypothetical protein EMIHUDRAFT_454298 [Emiliania huxleyi CCMP1516]|uniref:FAM91 N-terminal domain-containing protein n=2 Tax=Emiliania huxleyi TaxID=2903 RepID=A0A0D3KWI5_EMIH1|nr:hypothetical protein EMIHUDRAFT_454298 [Emiliania huxleyi CCMP1516]EOD40120.1 hypothetical protein EMIHUDRAFT_454298 [Emiliania huxleyi CCMP1516]|eukprot:XP_005792549.1 hypothetical protein EMIHUDRAFT_454298 [Emiliania huxleyi CCMP1516]
MPESTAEGEAVAQWLEKRPTAVQWEVLPPALRARLGSEAAWLRALRAHSLGLQLPWSSALGVEEKEYLAELLKASRERLLLYPYHLARRLAACWPAETPFRYYREMLFEMLRSERSYDTIPNFTAADAARLLRVGRNEFLHALNECRSKGWLWKRRRGLIMKQLPSAPPPDLPLEDWWVAVEASDKLAVPPLVGFVMNRVGNDWMEKLLYELFVSNDETAEVRQLASLLDQPLDRVLMAASLACRLGFAKKKAPPEAAAAAGQAEAGGAQARAAGGGLPPLSASATSAPEFMAAPEGGGEVSPRDASSGARIALLVDSKLAASLMMSNLAAGLKQHAVTLYEVGKIPAESLDAFLEAAAEVERPHELELLEYFDHAISLRIAAASLRAACPGRPLDIVRTESLRELGSSKLARLLGRSYGLAVSMAPLLSHSETVFTRGTGVPHAGPLAPAMVSPWARLALYAAVGAGPPSVLLRRGTRLRSLPAPLASAPSAGGALVAINELLLLSPAYDAAPSRAAQVSFPLRAADLHPDLLSLEGTFGFVQLVRLSGEWVPLDLHLGLPLFDVCSSIQRDGLLREAAAPALAAAAEGWLGRVIDFAGAYSRAEHRC